MNDQTIANLRANERARQAAVVGPGFDFGSGRDLDGGEPRLEVDFHDVRVRIQILGLGQFDVGIPAGRLHAHLREHACPSRRAQQSRQQSGAEES